MSVKPTLGPIDPICGMTVADDSPRRFAFDGTTYFFCSDPCLKKFSADPAALVNPKAPPSPAPTDASVIYISPLHPEIRKQGPGVRPKCGLFFEPEKPGDGHTFNPVDAV